MVGRTAGKGDGDAGADLYPVGCHGGDRQRREGTVGVFQCYNSVETRGLRFTGGSFSRPQIVVWDVIEDTHAAYSLYTRFAVS
jgi:hypothetical protein